MNFQCVRSCIQNSKDKEKALQEGEPVKPDEPKPFKVDDKVDYKPDGEESFAKAKVKEVKSKDPENITYTLENSEGELMDDIKPEMIVACG